MSAIAKALSLRYPPLALYYAAAAPSGAASFRSIKEDHDAQPNKGGWGCALSLLPKALAGATIAFSRNTCHCPGSLGGLGLGRLEDTNFPGGREAFLRFLSNGNKHWEQGKATAEEMRRAGASADKLEEYLEGEGFKKSPELVLEYCKRSPRLEPRDSHVLIRPLTDLDGGSAAKQSSSNASDPGKANAPDVVIMLADVHQLSALTNLANYGRPGSDNVIIPFASGCQSIGLYPLHEGTQEQPRAVVGLIDIAARLYLRKLLGRELISFAIPWKLYVEMESNVEESFLTRRAWKTLDGEV
ncbi:MAG: DUF169 domain-containing protein [Deltaproteobacteria bacterium]|jgi:hypothetical protein|nr:DUF169 domain-containing protein [Deltaproteobacteria bacterium]